MNFELRPYQAKAVNAVEGNWQQFRRQLLVMATGAGKTICFAALAARQAGRCLILVHREELLQQAADKIRRSTDLIPAIERGQERASLGARVVVATVQSVLRRLARWPRDHFALVICDEAHLSTSDSWARVLAHFEASARVLGVTATPQREDQRQLGNYYEHIAAEVGLFDLIRGGFLAPIKVRTVPIQIDLNAVRTRAGEFADEDLGDAIAPYYREIARAILHYAPGRRTLAFLPLIASSQQFVGACRDAGLRAAHVDGQSEDRRALLRAFGAGELDLLANAQLLSTGYDEPGISCLLNLRPTRSKILYQQMIGRGTRLCPGKQDLLVLDFLWQFQRLGKSLIRPAHLVAANEEEGAEIQRRLEEGGELDLGDTQNAVLRDRDAELARKLAAAAGRRSRFFDATEWAARLQYRPLADYQPTMPWHELPVPDFLHGEFRKHGFDPAALKDKGQAAKTLDMIWTRRRSGLASFEQMAQLRALGITDGLESLASKSARELLSQPQPQAA